MPTISPTLLPILMLFASNVFMTFAWYGHLKFKESPLPLVVLASWGIAFFEYWLAVPANRWGSAVYSAAQLKTMQEVITLVVFAGFSVLYLKEPLGWNHALGFSLYRRRRVFDFSQMGVSYAAPGDDGNGRRSSLRGRRHPQYPSGRTVREQPQRAVRPLADVADPLVQVLQQAFLRRHGIAVQRQPHQHLAAPARR